MEDLLKEKLNAYILLNNPDLVVRLQTDYSLASYLSDKVTSVLPLMEGMLEEGKPGYLIEEVCLETMTQDLRPSKFSYVKTVIEEEFSADFERLSEMGVLTYEVINILEQCEEHFQLFNFSEQTQDDRFLRYAVIGEIHNYFN